MKKFLKANHFPLILFCISCNVLMGPTLLVSPVGGIAVGTVGITAGILAIIGITL